MSRRTPKLRLAEHRHLIAARLRSAIRLRMDDLSVRLVIPVGIVAIVVFVLTRQSGEAVANLLGALMTAVFAALTFQLLRRQDEASWSSARPFLWCSTECRAGTPRVVLENRSAVPALNIQVLLEVGYLDTVDDSDHQICQRLARGAASALPPDHDLVIAFMDPHETVDAVTVFLLFETHLGHQCAVHYRLVPTTADNRDPFTVAEMNMCPPSRSTPHSLATTSINAHDELIGELEVLASPPSFRAPLTQIRKRRTNHVYVDTRSATIEVHAAHRRNPEDPGFRSGSERE